MSPRRTSEAQAVAVVAEKVRAEATVALALATRVSTTGSPHIAADLLRLRDRLLQLADEMETSSRAPSRRKGAS